MHMKNVFTKILFFMAFSFISNGIYAQERFEGELLVKVLDDAPRMELLADYAYIDSSGKRWVTPKGYETDGASIPRVAWSLVGDRWGGRYRNAAVIHDYACDSKVENWTDVHLTFYRAMLTAGVNRTKAKLMYAAVYHFGPRWLAAGDTRSVLELPAEVTDENIKTLKEDMRRIESSGKSEADQLKEVRAIEF